MILSSLYRLSSRLISLRKSVWVLALFAGLIISGLQFTTAYAEGSKNLYPPAPPAGASRGNFEWRTSKYGNLIFRRTLLKVYAQAGEYILMGSSGMDATIVGGAPNNSNILVYRDAQITGVIGAETIPAPGAAVANCKTLAGASVTYGYISTRAQELAGAQSVTGLNPAGYEPCVYQAPTTGFYDVVILGPKGVASDADGTVGGDVALTDPNDTSTNQATSVAAWDVAVRATDASIADIPGRVFSYAVALKSPGNGFPMFSPFYVVTLDGYQYQINLNGADGFGFMLYANTAGFFNSDGVQILNRDALGDNSLSALNGGVTFERPAFPIFFNPPDPATLVALGIPVAPVAPLINNFTFTGAFGANKTSVGTGGTFDFDIINGVVTQIIVAHDPVTPTFDQFDPLNSVLTFKAGPGHHTIHWNGLDQNGVPFPISPSLILPYKVQAQAQSGNVHFPLIDIENSTQGGPNFQMLNPPGALCPPYTGGCTGAFYNDNNYITSNGTPVGTNTGPVATELCGDNPPAIANSDPINGYDSTTTNRAYGAAAGGNATIDCSKNPPASWGTFGDAKALDVWTFYPSSTLPTTILIVPPPPPPPPGKPGPTPTPKFCDVTLTSIPNLKTALIGDPVVFNLTIKNNGASPVTNAVVTDSMPTFLIKSATSSQGTHSISGTTVTFNIGTLNPGQTVTMTIHAVAQVAGPVSDSLTIGGDGCPTIPGVAGLLPLTGEHPIDPMTTPWLLFIPVGFAAMAFTLGRRRQIA